MATKATKQADVGESPESHSALDAMRVSVGVALLAAATAAWTIPPLLDRQGVLGFWAIVASLCILWPPSLALTSPFSFTAWPPKRAGAMLVSVLSMLFVAASGIFIAVLAFGGPPRRGSSSSLQSAEFEISCPTTGFPRCYEVRNGEYLAGLAAAMIDDVADLYPRCLQDQLDPYLQAIAATNALEDAGEIHDGDILVFLEPRCGNAGGPSVAPETQHTFERLANVLATAIPDPYQPEREILPRFAEFASDDVARVALSEIVDPHVLGLTRPWRMVQIVYPYLATVVSADGVSRVWGVMEITAIRDEVCNRRQERIFFQADVSFADGHTNIDKLAVRRNHATERSLLEVERVAAGVDSVHCP